MFKSFLVPLFYKKGAKAFTKSDKKKDQPFRVGLSLFIMLFLTTEGSP